MTGWQRLFGRSAELRDAHRQVASAAAQVASLRASLDHARRQQEAAELAVAAYAEREQRLRTVVGDASQRPEVVLARVMQVLMEGPAAGPVSGGGQQ